MSNFNDKKMIVTESFIINSDLLGTNSRDTWSTPREFLSHVKKDGGKPCSAGVREVSLSLDKDTAAPSTSLGRFIRVECLQRN